MNSILNQLPDSRAVAAELAAHYARARQLRALWRLLRRLEQQRGQEACDSNTGGTRCKS